MSQVDTSYAGWLASLDAGSLTALLARRHDATVPPRPQAYGELAERLEHPASLILAAGLLRLPELQTLHAVLALGGLTGVRPLRALLSGSQSGSPEQHDASVEESLKRLAELGLCWQVTGADGAQWVLTHATLLELAAGEGPVSPPYRMLLPEVTSDGLRQILRSHGVRAVGNKAALLAEVGDLLGDVAAVDRLLDAAPAGCRAELARLASHPSGAPVDFSPDSYRRRTSAVEWASPRGLVFVRGYSGYDLLFPAEVTLALRGKDFRMPFTPLAPSLHRLDVNRERLHSETTAAASAFLDLATDLLDRLDRQRLPTLAGGGLGARSLTKLAKAAAADEASVRLALELGLAAGLVQVTPVGPRGARTVGTTERFARWRAAEPSERFAALLWAWWLSGAQLSESRDGDGKAMPALRAEPGCAACRAARTATLDTLRQLGAEVATTPGDLALRVLWERPGVHGSEGESDEALTSVLREARLVGAVALGALTPLGLALVEAETTDHPSASDADRPAVPAAVSAVATSILPAATERAAFAADLTAVVTGPPSARVSAVLDLCADREGRGGATVWRISPASVRRAMDEGATAEGLLADLAGVAMATLLPQPLVYLVGDVARRHGRLQVAPAISLVRSDDEALLAAVAVDRRLRRLGARLLAPTILACAVPVDEVLDALRAAGYFPVPLAAAEEEPPGQLPAAGAAAPSGLRDVPGAAGLVSGRPSGKQPMDHPADVRPPDDPSVPDGSYAGAMRAMVQGTSGRAAREAQVPPAQLADELLSGRQLRHRVPDEALVEELALFCALPSAEVRLLAYAVATGGPITVGYQSGTGGHTVRTISDAVHSAGRIFAWCGLRHADREFVVDRIRSVAPYV